MSREHDVLAGMVLDESIEFSLSELCRVCHVHAEVVIQLVEVGVIEPRGSEPADWRFAGQAVWRIERALNLQRDLDVNLAGAALALELLDEIDQLRDRLRALEGG
jgi:chaperone modulatory protein CbpM